MSQNTPPPYEEITGIAKALVNHVQNVSAAEYNGTAKPGDIVVDLTNYQLYIGNAEGNLNIVSGGGGNGSPGGFDTYVQFNESGLFGGTANLTYNYSNNILNLTGALNTGTLTAGNVGGNLIPTANIQYSLGSQTHQWKDLWVSSSTIYINSVPLTIGSANNLQVANANVVTASNTGQTNVNTLTATGNVAGGNVVTPGYVSATGNVTANYFFGNAAFMTGIPAGYSNANVATYLPIYTGNIGANNVNATGNVSGSYILGNGALLTGIPAGYSNANVATYLPIYTGNIGANNVNATGAIQSNSIAIGNVVPGSYFLDTNSSGISIGQTAAQQLTINGSGIFIAGTGGVNIQGIAGANIVIGSGSTSQIVVGSPLSSNSLISTTGNVSGTYILGNGAFLTGISGGGNSTYGDSNVEALLASGNVSTNIITTANVTGAYILGNGSQLTGISANYGDANVEALLSSGNVSTDIVTTGNILGDYILAGGNISTSGNVTGAYILGNGSQLTGIASSYGDSNVEALLSSGTVATDIVTTGNILGDYITAGVNISALGNVEATYFIGNGSQLTGVVSSYGDSNVEALLDGGTLVTDIITNGNLVVNSNTTTHNLTVTSLSNLGNIGNVFIAGGSAGQGIVTDGSGNLSFANIIPSVIPAVYFVAPVTANNQTFSNTVLSGYSANTDITLFYNGALLENTYYTFSGDTLTINIQLMAGDSIDAIQKQAGNVNVIQNSNYGNANVSSYLPTYAGNFGAGNVNVFNSLTSSNISAAYNVTAKTLSTGTNNVSISGNIISANTDITIDPLNDGTPLGNLVILGNLQVAGNLTYVDASTAITSNLVWEAANTSSTPASASGGGLAVGPAGSAYATWTYNQPANVWQSNLGISAIGNVYASAFYGDGYNLSNINIANVTGGYGNSNVAGYLASNTLATNIDTLASMNAGGSVVGATLSSTGNVIATGNVDSANISVSGNITTANLTFSNVNLVSGSDSLQANIGGLTVASASGSSTVSPTSVSTTGSVIGGNVSAVGDITGNNIVANGDITANGNLYPQNSILMYSNYAGITLNTGNNISILAGGELMVSTFAGNSTLTFNSLNTATVNATTVNATTLSATGNVTGSYLLGNGSQITSLPTSLGNWISTTLAITAQGGAITYPTNSTHAMYYRKLGPKQWEVWVLFTQPSAPTGGNSSTGDFLITLPNSLSFDTSQPLQGTNTASGSWADIGLGIPTSGGLVLNTASATNPGINPYGPIALAYSATQFRLYYWQESYWTSFWGNGGAGAWTNGTFINTKFQFTSL